MEEFRIKKSSNKHRQEKSILPAKIARRSFRSEFTPSNFLENDFHWINMRRRLKPAIEDNSKA